MKFKLSPLLLAYLLLCIVILYIFTYFSFYKPLNNHYSSFNSIPILDDKKISQGYTLIAPYNRMLTDNPKLISKIYLLDLFGNAVHTWSSKHQALNSILKPNGNLLVISELPKYSVFYPPGGNTGTVSELDWNSKAVWEYKNERIHTA